MRCLQPLLVLLLASVVTGCALQSPGTIVRGQTPATWPSVREVARVNRPAVVIPTVPLGSLINTPPRREPAESPSAGGLPDPGRDPVGNTRTASPAESAGSPSATGSAGDPARPDADRAASAKLPTSSLRMIGLADAIRLALDASPIVKTLDGGVRIATTTQFDPQIADLRWQQELAEFAPLLKASYVGSQFDQPPSSFIGPGVETETRFDEGAFRASLEKKWGWGTTTSLAYDPSLSYLFFPDGAGSAFNPAYSSRLALEIRQPLLQGGGPSANLAPVRIARARTDQSQWEVEAEVLAQIRSVEQSYWELKAAMAEWQILGVVIPLAEQIVHIEELRLKAERTIYSDLARARVSLESLRRRRASAWNSVKRAEYNLRQLLGLPETDGLMLMPIDEPPLQYEPVSVGAAVETALGQRPDLQRRQLEVSILSLDLERARNGVKPALDLFLRYRINGLADRLDQSFDQLGSIDYPDWTVGAEYEFPLGNRRAEAALRESELRLARERARLTAEEQRVAFRLATLASQIETDWTRFESARRQIRETEEWVRVAKVRFSSPPPTHGKDSLLLALLDYQTAIERHVDSVSLAAETMADYRTSLALLHEEQGTGLQRWQVKFAGSGPDVLPATGPSAVIGPATNGIPVGHSLSRDPYSSSRRRSKRVAPGQTRKRSF